MPSDAAQMMMYDANKKSTGLAYLFWFFFGSFGVHRFYAGRRASAAVMLILTIFCIITMIIGIGLVWFITVAPWLIVDAFLIPGMIRSHNTSLASRMGFAPGVYVPG
jgi:TM2 domain-containing membrane protein YozV